MRHVLTALLGLALLATGVAAGALLTPRYQVERLDNHFLARLDTRTGEMRLYVTGTREFHKEVEEGGFAIYRVLAPDERALRSRIGLRPGPVPK